jgi:tol-pal system protein YbgF
MKHAGRRIAVLISATALNKAMKRAGLFLAISLLAAWPALAQSQRTSLADRVLALEQKNATQTQTAGQANVELLNRSVQMQDEIRSLRATIEQLQNELEQARQRNREQYIDMDSRVSALEQGGTAAKPAATPTAAPSTAAVKTAAAASAGENAEYQTAYQRLIKQGDAAGAAQLFQAFLQRYPDSALAPNAWYWLGESYYINREFALALKSFELLVQRFESSNKTPDAALKAAYCQLELGQAANGRQQLEQVIARYPSHPVAELARSRLRGLNLGQ